MCAPLISNVKSCIKSISLNGIEVGYYRQPPLGIDLQYIIENGCWFLAYFLIGVDELYSLSFDVKRITTLNENRNSMVARRNQKIVSSMQKIEFINKPINNVNCDYVDL